MLHAQVSNNCFSTTNRVSCTLICSTLLFLWSCLAPSSGLATECLINQLSGAVETITSDQHSYNFSGPCVTQKSAQNSSVSNFHYDGTGLWEISTKKALEKVSTPYGLLHREFQCDYDPWLEPQATCTISDFHWSAVQGYPIWDASQDFAQTWMAMNNNKILPVSMAIFDESSRADLVTRIISRSIKIIAPINNQKFDSPDLIITVVMERPVIHPPQYAVHLKVKEFGWPEPGQTMRSYEEGKNYLSTADKLTTYFNMKGKDLWNAQWTASAHFVSSDPYWSSNTYFEVGAEVQEENQTDLPEPGEALEKPIIHTPRPNHTYTIEQGFNLEISYQKFADLHVQISYRATGQSNYTLYHERVVTVEEARSPGFLRTEDLSLMALQAGSQAVDIKIDAWCTYSQQTLNGSIPENRSETSSVAPRVLVSPLSISGPLEGQVFSVPAQVLFVIPITYKGLADDADGDITNFLDVEMQWDGPNHLQSVPKIFKPYSKGSYSVFGAGNSIYVNYACNDLGHYRFRARLSFEKNDPNGATGTFWSEWRQIQLVGSIPFSTKTDISPYTSFTTIQKQDSKQLTEEQLHNKKLSAKSLVELRQQKIKKIDVPVFTQPQELQEVRPGVIRFKIKGIEEKQLEWQMEYKKFDSLRYQKNTIHPSGVRSVKGEITGVFQTARKGDYRIRVRSKEKANRWSPWRMFQVGSPNKTSFIPQPKKTNKQLSEHQQDTDDEPQVVKSTTFKPLSKPPKPTFNNTIKPRITE